MSTFIEMAIYIGYSLLAPIVTAGGSMITTNILALTGVDFIKATGITSAFFCANGFIACFVFRKDIVWTDVKRMFVPVVLGAFLGAYILVNISPILLMVAMLFFSLYFIYKKVTIEKAGIQTVSYYKDLSVGFFSSAVTATALPGGGFMNAYFASKGFHLTQMFGTLNFLVVVTFIIKVSVMLENGILKSYDLLPVLYAVPFLILTNYLVRKGLLKLSKKATDIITVLVMVALAIYLFVSIILSL